MKRLIAGALAAPFLYLGMTMAASAAMGAQAYPQGLSSPPPAHVLVRHPNRGRQYGWARGRHDGRSHALPPHARPR
mgnify:CR=1 FL=1